MSVYLKGWSNLSTTFIRDQSSWIQLYYNTVLTKDVTIFKEELIHLLHDLNL